MLQLEISPSQIVRPDTVIRLTCYRPASAETDLSTFTDSWRQMAADSPRTGILYRELNRQVPEWTQLAAAEMDNPIDAVFLEYLVVEPQVDIGAIPALPRELAHQAGARVIATASGKNVERVLSLGADVVVDYKTQRFEEFARGVDAVLDTVGGETRDRSGALIRKGGVLASLLPPPPEPEKAAAFGIQAFMVHGHPNVGEIMPEMTRMLEVGELAFPEVAAIYSLGEASKAHADFERSSPRGRLVLTVD